MLKKIWHDSVWSKVIANAIWEYRKDIILVSSSIFGLSIVSYVFNLFKIVGKLLASESTIPNWLLIVSFVAMAWKSIDCVNNLRYLFKERFRDRFKERDEEIKEARNELEDIKRLLVSTTSPTDMTARKTPKMAIPGYSFQVRTVETSNAETIDRSSSTPASNVSPAEIPILHLTNNTDDYIDNRIVRLLYDGEPQSASAITKHLGIDSDGIRYSLIRLVRNGVVRQQSSKDFAIGELYTLDKNRLLEITRIETKAQ
jgi:hypothetical protein